MGIAYLHGYRFQINQRGYANVVPSPDDVVAGLCYLLSEKDEAVLDINEVVKIGAYKKEVLDVEIFLAKAAMVGRRVSEIIDCGLVRGSVDGKREGAQMVSDPLTREDRTSPGRPDSIIQDMTKKLGLEPSAPVSDQQAPATGQQEIQQGMPEVTVTGETLQALVYVSRQYTTEGKPRPEYVNCMNLGIADALKLGISEEHVKAYVRIYLPLGNSQVMSNEELELLDSFSTI